MYKVTSGRNGRRSSYDNSGTRLFLTPQMWKVGMRDLAVTSLTPDTFKVRKKPGIPETQSAARVSYDY
ncbi:unnamed protein product [Penicillium camemberti]|uniref:Str. FM013 n=1 Tax=Penicillium camemberti (strain FM 013) TaxID=1429867 RepID=A0A0G4PBA5_PENC3|nr:unnamed protein product [Penicillium camemberti]